jgi:hypothetical protein
MVSTTADAQFLSAAEPAERTIHVPAPDNSEVGFSAPNGIYLIISVLSAIGAFVVPYLLTAAGPHH